MQKTLLVAALLLPLLVIIPISAHAQSNFPIPDIGGGTGVAISDDGSTMLIVRSSQYFVHTLGTPFDITTASLDSAVAVPDANARMIQDVILSSTNDRIYFPNTGRGHIAAFELDDSDYSLGNSLGGHLPRGFGGTLSNDGNWVFIGEGNVRSYQLGTPYDISTQSTPNNRPHGSFNPAGMVQGMSISTDGTRLFVMIATEIRQFNLNPAYHINGTLWNSPDDTFVPLDTASYRGMDFSPDGTMMYLLDSTGIDAIRQYVLPAAFTLPTTAVITANAGITNGSSTAEPNIRFTVRFNEDVSGFDENGIVLTGTVNGGSPMVSEFVADPDDAALYTFDVNVGSTIGDVTVSIPAGMATSISDSTANSAPIPFTATFTVLNADLPTVTISSTDVPNNGISSRNTIRFNATFSESVSGFTEDDIMVSSTAPDGTHMASSFMLENPSEGTRFSFEVQRNGVEGTITVSVPAGVAVDSQTNDNEASNNYVTTFGTSATVQITDTTPADANGKASFNATFSDIVTGFGLDGIIVDSDMGTHVPSNLTGSGAEYAFDVLRGANDATITVSIPANVTGGNEASNTLSVDLELFLSIDYTRSNGLLRTVRDAQDIDFTNTGNRIFILNHDVTNTINRYALGTNFNPLSADSDADQSYTVILDNLPREVEFSANGQKMFVLDADDRDVREYNLGGDFDISNPGTVDTLPVTAASGVQGLAFSRDGTHMYVIDSTDDSGRIYGFPLDVGFDLSSGDANDLVTSPALQRNQRSLAVNDDGTVMYVLGVSDLYAYTFGVAYDVSTLSLEATQPLGITQPAQGFVFSPDRERMYVVGDGATNTIIEFTRKLVPPIIVLPIIQPQYVINEGISLQFGQVAGRPAAGFTLDGVPADFAPGGALEDAAITPGGAFSWTPDTAGTFSFNVTATNTGGSDIEPIILRVVNSITPFVAGELVADDTFDRLFGDQPAGIQFSNDGLHMFVLESGDSDITRYTTITPFDFANTTSDTNSDITRDFESSVPRSLSATDLEFSNDGRTMILMNEFSGELYEFALDAPYVLDPRTQVNTLTPTNLAGGPNGFTISSDGTKLFIVEGLTPANSRVHEHTLAIPFSISDVTYDRSLNLGSNPATPQDVAFYNSTAMLVVGADSVLHEYAVDSSSISYSGIFQTLPIVGPRSMAVADNGLHLFAVESTTVDIFRYSVATSSFTTEIDSNPPGATAADGIASFNVEFGRSVTGFELSDITISSVAPNGTALSAGTHVPSNLTGSGAEYAFDVLRGADDATITVSIPANAVGSNEASNAYSIDLSLNVMLDYTSSSSITTAFAFSADIDFSGSGDAIFIINDGGDQIHRYALSTNFNSSTATSNIGPPIYSVTQDTSPRALEFSTNGQKMFVLGTTANEILEYDLSGAFDISNPTYLNDDLDISAATTGAQGMEFSRDGTHLYVIDSASGGGRIYGFSLDVAFDVSSGDANDFVTSPIIQAFQRSLAVNDDGTVMYVLTARDLYAYTFGVAYDVSTLSLEATQPLGTANSAQGLAFSTDFTTMSFVRNDPSNTVHEFTLNAEPVLGDLNFGFTEDENLSNQIPGSDLDGDTLEYSLSNHPDWLSIDSDTGQLSGIVPQDNTGLYRAEDTPARCAATGSVSFTVTVSDDGFDGDDTDDVSRDYTVGVFGNERSPNNAPVNVNNMNIPLVSTSTQLDLSLYTSDTDAGDILTYSFTGLAGNTITPGSLAIDSDTGLATFMSTGNTGTATIDYIVCDGSVISSLQVMTSTTAVISGITDQSINEGQTLNSLPLYILSHTESPIDRDTIPVVTGELGIPLSVINFSRVVDLEKLDLQSIQELVASGADPLQFNDTTGIIFIDGFQIVSQTIDEETDERTRHTISDTFVTTGIQSPPIPITYTFALEDGSMFFGGFDITVNKTDVAANSTLPAEYVVGPRDANTLVFLDQFFEDPDGDDIMYNVTNPDPGIVDLSILSSSNILIIDPVSPGIVVARLCAESMAPGIATAATCEAITVLVLGIPTTESGIFQDSSVNVNHGLLDADVVLNWNDFAIDPTVAFNHIIITANNASATGEIRINQTDRATLVPELASNGTTIHTRIFPSNGSGSISYDPTSDFTSTSDSVTFTAVLHGPAVVQAAGVGTEERIVTEEVIALFHDSLTVNYIIVTVNTDAAPGLLQGDLAFGPRHTSDRFAIPLDDLFVDVDNSRPHLDVTIMGQSNQALTASIVGDRLIVTPPGPNCNCQTLFTFALDDGVNPPQPEQLLFRFESDPAGTVPVGFPQSPVGRFFLPPGFEPFLINLADQVVRGDAAFAENVMISNVQLPEDGNGVTDNSHITATMHNATHYQIAPGTNDLIGSEIITFDVGFVEDPVNANVFTSYRFEFADAPETAQQQVSSGGGDDDTQWKTKPTFGKSYTTGQKIVDCGYSMDNVCRDVTDYHVDYKRNTIETDSLHDFTLTAYAQNGLRSFNIGFGLPGIGSPLNAAEAQINVNLIRDYSINSTYMIDSVEYSNENRVIGEDATFEISRVQCLPTDKNELCVRLSIDGVLFRETLYDEPFAINALDSKRRGTTHYMNEGLLVYGDSLNAPPTHELSERHSNQGDAVKLHLTRTDKLADVWTDQLGHQWTKNAFGTWSYVDAPPVDMSSACTDEDNRACDAFAQKRDAHIIQMEELRDFYYGGIYTVPAFDDLETTVSIHNADGDSREAFLVLHGMQDP